MKKKSKIILLVSLWRHLSKKRKAQFNLLIVLMILTSFAEVLSIGSVLPFLAALSDPQILFSSHYLDFLVPFLKSIKPSDLVLFLTIAFVFFAFLAGSMRLILLWFSTRLCFLTGADLGLSMYQKSLYQPFKTHIARNSSSFISAISMKSDLVIYHTIMPAVTFISSSIIITIIVCVLFFLSPYLTISIFLFFGLIYFAIAYYLRKKLASNSEFISIQASQVLRSLNEGFGAIRDVLIDKTQTFYSSIYQESDLQLRRSQGNNLFIGQSPRYIIEALGMILIALLAYSLFNGNHDLSKAIPFLGLLVLASQRLLPLLQQIFSSWSSINGNMSSLKDVLLMLDQKIYYQPNLKFSRPLTFNRSIQLHNLFFKYSNKDSWVLKNINLTIKKGERIGVIGRTGAGKSTLIDLIMCLFSPSKGSIKIDGKLLTSRTIDNWQLRIAHIPQSIYLSDDTILNNIAFGVNKDKIDKNRVIWAANLAQISSFINKLPGQYSTKVGERGARLSGGQRQRIGIARALYKKADVLVFDEATSALDTRTERSVISEIEKLDKQFTIIMVAHRLSTLKNCDRILELDNGRIKKLKNTSISRKKSNKNAN